MVNMFLNTTSIINQILILRILSVQGLMILGCFFFGFFSRVISLHLQNILTELDELVLDK